MPNEFTDMSVNIGTATSPILSVPCICPHCGFSMAPNKITHAVATHVSVTTYLLLILKANCCSKTFYAVYTKGYNAGDKEYKYSTHFPKQMPKVLPRELSFSPRFIALHAQAHTAELHGHFELAGSGYRNAIEVLIKDFAVTKMGEPENKVAAKSLREAIESYLPGDALKNGADMVRYLGNDSTHYQQKHDGLSFSILKDYVEIFITRISSEIKMLEPPIQMPRNQEPQS